MMNTINLKGHEFVIRYISHVKANEGFNIHTLRVDSMFGSYEILYDTAEERDADMQRVIDAVNNVEPPVRKVYVLHSTSDNNDSCVWVFKTHKEAHRKMIEELKDYIKDYDDEYWYEYDDDEEIEPDVDLDSYVLPNCEAEWNKWDASCDFGEWPRWGISEKII